MSSSHHATFTWGPGPQSVFVAGGFNDWSDHATPLQKNADGSFAAEVPLPWGQKQAFKYVVDGEWKVREDEAKEWDAAGNMNNVYTAPPAPVEPESHAAPVAAASETPAAADAVPVAEEKKEEEKAEATEPSTLLAASAPSAASAGPVLGAPAVVNTSSTPVVTTTTTTTAAPVTNDAPASTDISAPVAAEPLNAKIEKVAANANIGEAQPAGQDEGVLNKVAVAGGAALATLGAVVGSAAVAVERATGVDLTHSQPISVEEAKAKGIDVNSLEKVDAPTDAVSPVGTKPSEAAVADLDEKLKDLKVASGAAPTSSVSKSEQVAVPLPAASAAAASQKPNDIPAQNETKENHSVVPSPVVTNLSDKDPKKDRTADSGTAAPATVHTQPVSKNPAVDPKKAKEEAEAREVPREQKSSASSTGPAPVAAAVLPAGQATAAPDQKANNIGSTSSSTPSATKPAAAAATPAAPKPVEKDVFSSSPSAKSGLPAASAGTTHTTTAPTAPSPATAAPPAAAASAPPATPAKSAPTAASVAAPSSVASTPAGTPAKSSHLRDSTTGSGADVKKRKSGFFHKIKTAFSPKDKEKK